MRPDEQRSENRESPLLSRCIPLPAVVVVICVTLLVGVYGRLIVGDRYHLPLMLAGFLLPCVVALAYARRQSPEEGQPPVSEMDRRAEETHRANLEAHAARMEAHRASMERHEVQMVLTKLEAKRVRQLIRQDKRDW